MVISEFPTVRIDDFRQSCDGEETPEIGFLTHMHEDHTAGLSRKSYYGPLVYCTSVTRAMVLNFRTKSGAGELKYNHLRQEHCGKEILKIMDVGKPRTFELSHQTIEVTFIDANHCPGAVMILIKDKWNAILFTGDIRCERKQLNMISHTTALGPFLAENSSGRKITLYVDDTFSMHVDPFKSYPDNSEGIQMVLELVQKYPQQVHFCLADSVTGHEEILIRLAEQLNTRIHMSQYMHSFYLSSADSSPLLQRLVKLCETGNNKAQLESCRVHFCQRNESCPMRKPHCTMAYLKPCNQPSHEDLAIQNRILKVTETAPGMMVPFDENRLVQQGISQRYFLDPATKKHFPLFPWFHFSRHASFPELCALARLLNTREVKSIRGPPLPQFKEYTVHRNFSYSKLVAQPVSIPRHEDRVKISRLRKAAKERRVWESSSSLDVMEEEAQHEALTLLCQPKRPCVRLPSKEPSTPSFCSPPETSRQHQLADLLRRHPSAWFDFEFEFRVK